jgi:hypothetical protein
MPFAIEREMLKTKTSTCAMRESTLAVGRFSQPAWPLRAARFFYETRAFNG